MVPWKSDLSIYLCLRRIFMKKTLGTLFMCLGSSLIVSGCDLFPNVTIKEISSNSIDKNVVVTATPVSPSASNPASSFNPNVTTTPVNSPSSDIQSPSGSPTPPISSPSVTASPLPTATPTTLPEISLSFVPSQISLPQSGSTSVRVFLKVSDSITLAKMLSPDTLKMITDNLKLESKNLSIIKITDIQIINPSEILINIKAVSTGETKITATYQGKTYEISISVSDSSSSRVVLPD